MANGWTTELEMVAKDIGETAEINVSFDLMGLEGTHSVTDLWTGEKLGKFTGEFSSEIRRHGAGLYRIH